VLRTPVNECLDPKKEAPSFKGAFLVSAPPSSGGRRDGILVRVGALRRLTSPIFEG